MKQKHIKYVDNQLYPFNHLDRQTMNLPVKSPSPDKKRSNIITPTKSPELMEIKRNITPARLSDRKFERTPVQSKPFQQSTRYYTNQDFQQYRSSQKKNEVLEELENLSPEEFVLGNSHLQYRSQAHPNSKELDYIKLLQQKQRTIKQLHQIIEMINRNNSLDLSNSQLSGAKQKRIFQSSDKTVLSYKSNDLTTQKELKNQVRILTIQNQQLIHMIEKINEEKKTYQETQQNLKKDKQDYTAHRMKQEILSRQIYEMKQSLIQKDEDYEMLLKQNKQLYNKYLQLDQQNQKLIKMMKDKQSSDRKYHASLIESSVSQKSGISQSQTKDKLSLIKIKEQYNEGLKVFKDTVCHDVQQFMREIETNTRDLENRLKEMENQVQNLQRFRLAHESIKNRERQQSEIMKQNTNRSEIQQLSDIQLTSPQKQKHKEIQSLLMQKNELYEKQIHTQRSINRKITDQMRDLKIKNEQLESKYNQLLEQNNQMTIKLKLEMSESRKKNMGEIEDINIAKAQQGEIKKLRQLIKSYEEQFETQQRQLVSEIISLKNKTQSYEKIIQSQRQQFEQKQMDVQTKISQKEFQLRRNSSKFQSEIDHLRELISEKKLSIMPVQDLALESEVESLRQTVHEKDIELQAKAEEIENLKTRQKKMQENEEYMREEISKLVENYEKEINILKTTLSNDQQRHQTEISEIKSQIRKLISQSQNSEQLLIDSQSNHNVEVSKLNQRIEQLENELNYKNRQSSELLHSKEALLIEHSEIKEHLEQLLNISNQVQQMQDQNKELRGNLAESQMQINDKQSTINHQEIVIKEQQQANDNLSSTVKNMQRQIQQHKMNIIHLQNELEDQQQKLGTVRKQSQDQMNQKNVEFAVEVQRYLEEKSEYQFIIKQLKEQLSTLNLDIDLLKEQSLTYRDGYNELLYIKESNLLNQLYQLRSLVAKSLTQGTDSQTFKEVNYDLGKLYIQYQAKIEENQLLHSSLEQLKQQAAKNIEEKHLMEEKVSFLEKNISIYQNQLRQRKNFCERLINQKTKIQKELLLLKKLKLESRQEDSDLMKQNLMERVNNIVRLEEKRQSQVKRCVQKRSESPIRQFNSLISKVEEFQTFTTKKVQPQIK